MLEGVVSRNSTFILLSANAFNLDQSKILSFGKELNWDEATHEGVVSRNNIHFIISLSVLKIMTSNFG